MIAADNTSLKDLHAQVAVMGQANALLEANLNATAEALSIAVQQLHDLMSAPPPEAPPIYSAPYWSQGIVRLDSQSAREPACPTCYYYKRTCYAATPYFGERTLRYSSGTTVVQQSTGTHELFCSYTVQGGDPTCPSQPTGCNGRHQDGFPTPLDIAAWNRAEGW